jgi:dienelactone hydrolase
LITRIWYPAASGRAGSVTADAPIAAGRFPLILFSHGWGGVPESYLSEIVPLAAAGFIVAAPEYPTSATGRQTNLQDGVNGNQSLDASTVISQVIAFGGTAGNPFHQHVDTSRGVGAAGHSLGGITTHGLLSLRRDSRVTAAVILAGQGIGTPTGPAANVLFIHGDQDPTVGYSGARGAYDAIRWPKAFLTHLGQGHDSWVWGNGATYPQTRAVLLDWMRWSLYGDQAARRRLPGDAAAGGTKWESANLGG